MVELDSNDGNESVVVVSRSECSSSSIGAGQWVPDERKACHC